MAMNEAPTSGQVQSSSNTEGWKNRVGTAIRTADKQVSTSFWTGRWMGGKAGKRESGKLETPLSFCSAPRDPGKSGLAFTSIHHSSSGAQVHPSLRRREKRKKELVAVFPSSHQFTSGSGRVPFVFPARFTERRTDSVQRWRTGLAAVLAWIGCTSLLVEGDKNNSLPKDATDSS
jgi:hypothetical protein